MNMPQPCPANQFGGPNAEPPFHPPLPIKVGDLVRVKPTATYEVVGTVLAYNERVACLSPHPGSWDTYDRRNIAQIIKRANTPPTLRHWRIRAEVFYLVKADSADEALTQVQEHPDQRIDFVLAESEDVTPFSL